MDRSILGNQGRGCPRFWWVAEVDAAGGVGGVFGEACEFTGG